MWVVVLAVRQRSQLISYESCHQVGDEDSVLERKGDSMKKRKIDEQGTSIR